MRSLLALLSLALFPVGAEVPAVASGVAHVAVFDCYLPIPPGYVLDASDRERFSFYRPTASPSGMIRIEAHPGIHERWEVISDEAVGHLRLVELRLRSEVSQGEIENLRISLIHDGVTQASLLGEARAHARRMAHECSAKRRKTTE